MHITEIEELWANDCDIHLDDLATDSAAIGKLHSKYYKFYRTERPILKALELKYRQAIRVKTEYYMGKLSDRELKENGWDQFPLLLMKQDVPTYLEADSDLITLLIKIAHQQEKVDFLESIIKVINNRSFAIKNSIDFLKWTGGQS